ncbi:MAG: glycosyltransferase family 4 protein, partial [Fimbriimonadales bacterium]
QLAAKGVREAARVLGADVVHFHNTFPIVSPAAYRGAKDAGAAVVQTLHNYRLACVNALLFRSGRVCTDCVGRGPWPGMWRRCYRRSFAASAAAAFMITHHRRRGTWLRDVDLYLAVSEYVRAVVIETGLAPERVRVKPNFLSPDPGLGPSARSGAAYVGRLSEEKGIHTVLEAWRRHPELPPLTVAGDGPCRKDVERDAGSERVRFLGSVQREEALRLLGESVATVLPSLCPDAMPMSLVESFAKGTPVVASDVPSLKSLVKHQTTGIVFTAGDPDRLAQAVWEAASPDTWSERSKVARSEYEDRYSAPAAIRALDQAYRWAIENRAS